MDWNKQIAPYVEQGYVKKVVHPRGDLFLYDYTDLCVVRRAWDEVTTLTRGLVVDNEGHIVAQGFHKFFNPHEMDVLPKGPFKVFEKLDGSMVMVTRTRKYGLIVNTRGSFTSDQAVDASWYIAMKHMAWRFKEGYTYIFEWIAPHNRHVVDYGDREDLVLLGVRDLRYPFHHDYDPDWLFSAWDGPKAQTFGFVNTIPDALHMIPSGEEGFVLANYVNERVKVKSEEYLALHRAIFNLSTVTCWEYAQKTDKEIIPWLESLSEEARFWAEEHLNKFLYEFYVYCEEVEMIFAGLAYRDGHDWIEDFIGGTSDKVTLDRKTFALTLKEKVPQKYHAALFRRYDSKPYKDLIWKMIKPERESFRRSVVETE